MRGNARTGLHTFEGTPTREEVSRGAGSRTGPAPGKQAEGAARKKPLAAPSASLPGPSPGAFPAHWWMMHLDLPSLVFLQGLFILAQVTALAVQYRGSRAYAGTGWWLAGSTAFAAGFFFLIANHALGWWVLGVLGNPMLMVAHLGFLVGTLRFLERPDRLRWALAALGAAVAVYEVFLILFPSITLRTALVSAVIGGFDLATARALLGLQGRRIAQPARFTAIVFLAHGAFLLIVAGFTLVRTPIQTYHDYALVQRLVFVLPAVASTLWTFGFILLLNKRLDAERLDSQAQWRRTLQEKADLELRNQQLQKAESLARMAGAIAHHYNNRLQAVMTGLDLLETAAPGPAFERALAKTKRATEHASEMARHMLFYLGRASLDLASQDLSALCRPHLAAMEPTLPPQVHLRTLLPDPGPRVHANAEHLLVALANLAENALEAMGEAGGDLRVQVGQGPAAAIPAAHRFPVGWQPEAGDHAWLEVADAGVGIEPADMEKLCDPFYSTKFTGRGLGLAVVLGIAQAHGGGMTVTSRPGGGSTFRIHLPVAGEA